MKVQTVRFDVFSPLEGGLRLEVHLADRVLPPSAYIFLGTPFRKDGTPGNEPEARRVLDVAAGLICLHTGLNFMRDCVLEGEVSGKDGNVTIPSQPRKMPQPPEGPYLGQQNGQDMAEISERLAQLGEPQRGRLELSLRLMDAAMRRDQGFFEYWTALEVVCDGKAGRIKERLARIYGLRSHAEAARQSGVEVLARWRGDYVHKGVEVKT
jgi:hypothetical protein